MKILLMILCFSALLYDASALVSDGLTLLSLLRYWTFVPLPINSSWIASDSSPCSWVGIQCNHNHNVVSLNLTSHGIFGQLGPEIGQLHHLQTILLLNNSFSGKIPPELGNCSVLEHLDLSKNSFNGEIPNELGMLSMLEDLDLSFNRLTGEIPVSIWRIQSLKHILVHNNSLFGELPLEMTELKHLRNLSLCDNHFSGVIPQSLGINSSLVKLDSMNNMFTGNIPPNLCYGKQLRVLNMGFNQLQGGIPSDVGRCASLTRLILTENNFTGSLPDFERNPNLKYMDISKNKVSGAIPPSLANCTNLTEIILSMNKFSGLIPSELGKLRNLLILDLAHNNLEGPLPPQLSNCTKMDHFDVGFNVLNGSFPLSLRSWTGLTTLILRENHFTGGVPVFLSEFDNLLELQLGGNLFGGEIPKSIGALQNLLYGLNLSANGLAGEIPLEIGKLTKLQNLDVSSNNLTGSIEVLDELLSLIEFNISNNSFNGPVPKRLMKFLNSSPSSFVGNSQLCVSCSPSDGLSCTKTSSLKPCVYRFIDHDHRRISTFVIVVIEVGSSIFFSAMLVILVRMNLRRRSKQELHASVEGQVSSSFILIGRGANANVGHINKREVMMRTEKQLPFLVRQVMKATNNLNDRYIVGRGAHGIVYKVQISPDLVLAGKKFAFSSNKGKSKHKLREIMIREIQIVGIINHPNLARYTDYWFGKDYGVILYKYMENGSLHDVLHERNPLPSIKWNDRLQIAVGIAQGLAYLHYDCRPPIVHRDIKPKNILLGSDMEPLITDFGTALRRRQHEHSTISETKRRLSAYIAGTIGYIAPEIAYATVPSRRSDVYSYGVVLLELITRKKVLDQSFLEEGTTLVRWVRSVCVEPEKIVDIVDSCLASEFSQSIVVKQVTAVLSLALRCTERDSRKRPTMRKVIRFYQQPILLKSRYDDVDDTEITAVAVPQSQPYHDSTNLIPSAPGVNINSVPSPTTSILGLREEVSNFWEPTNSLEDKKNKYESDTAWRFPPGGWVKVNTHGCATKYGEAACGGVIRGDNGEWLRGFTVNLQPCPNVTAEIWGLYHGLSVAWHLRFPRVIIETDSLIAVQLLMHIPMNKVNKLQLCAKPIALCHELIQRDWEVKIQYIFREGNFCAHWLVNHGHVGNDVYLEPPTGLVDFLNRDISRGLQ